MTALQCNEMVADDFGASLHQCTRNAIPTSNYCQQHHDKHHPPEFTPVPHQTEPSTRERVTARSWMTWEEGAGPQVKLQYGRKSIFIRTLSIEVDTTGPSRASLKAGGSFIKKDGTPAASGSDGTVILETLPPETRKMVEAEITHLLSLLPGGGAR